MMKRAAASVLFLLLMVGTAHATTYVMVADEDLVDGAAAIVLGTVMERAVVEIDGVLYTEHLLTVATPLKGDTADTIRVRSLGGLSEELGRGLILPGTPGFDPGEDALLFLDAGADGTYDFQHLEIGAFRVFEIDGVRVVHRPGLSPAELIDRPERAARRGSLRQAHLPRDLDRFMDWIADREQGHEREGDYYLDEDALAQIPVRFNLFDDGSGNNFHWHEFTSGVLGSVEWVMFKKEKVNGLKGKGKNTAKAWFKAWAKIFNVNTTFGGLSKAANGGLAIDDGLNGVLYNDRNNEIAGSFSCAVGGVLARGGIKVRIPPAIHGATGSGGNRTYWDAYEGDIVFQDGFECLLTGTKKENDLKGQEVGAHETGHALGFDHSCGGAQPACVAGSNADDALMRASAHFDGRSAKKAIKKDDKNAAKAADYKQ